MLTEAMNDADGSGGIWRSEFGMVKPNLFFLSIKVGLIDSIVLLFRFTNELFVHG
jgi:hypothetical protein